MITFTPANIRTWSRLGACGAFGLAALALPEEDDSVLMVTADLRYFSGLDRFYAKYPDKLINVGIAEQNMIGVAAGLAKEGFTPFATTYASFATTRCCDQVKVNMGYMQLGIKLVGLTSGLSVGVLGATHMSIEDIAIMRSIPNITILSPADCTETVKAVIAASKYKIPVYIRLSGGMGNPVVYSEDYMFEIGKAIKLREGKDICIIATGSMVYKVVKAAEMLMGNGISCSVVDMHTIKPLDKNIIDEACDNSLIVTVEEHSIHGGLGGAVAEYLTDKTIRPPQLIIGISDEYMHAGSYEFLIEQYGLSIEKIYKKILKKYKEVTE